MKKQGFDVQNVTNKLAANLFDKDTAYYKLIAAKPMYKDQNIKSAQSKIQLQTKESQVNDDYFIN